MASQKHNATAIIYEPKIIKQLAKFGKRRKLFWTIQLLLATVHIAGFVYGGYQKQRHLFDGMSSLLKYIDLLRDVILVITNIVGFYSLGNSFRLFDKIYSLRPKLMSRIDKRVSIITMIILYILIILTTVMQMYAVVQQYGWAALKYTIPGKFDFGLFNFTLFSLLHFAQEVEAHVSGVNEFLRKKIIPYFESKTLGIKTQHQIDNEMATCLENLQHITKHHELVCDMLDMLNETFKALLVLIIMTIIINLLWGVTVIIEYAVGQSGMLLTTGFTVLVLILIAVGQVTQASWIGEQISIEGEQTTKLCLSLINKLSNNQYSERIEKVLSVFLDQTKSRRVSFHAGGFFQVNSGILGTVMSTVATYSIVIIQFYLANRIQ